MSARAGSYMYLYGNLPFEVVRGHVPEADAIATVEREQGVTLPDAEAVHGWARLVPAPRGEEWDMTFVEAPVPGPGAFPVTYVRERRPEPPEES